jgi:hypothetical protein
LIPDDGAARAPKEKPAMSIRYRSYRFLRSAFTLGTSLTALFLLVRCSVPERDYAVLGIAGSGGGGGFGGGGTGGTAAGQGGSGGSSGSGGQAGASPLPPVPCDSNDAGATPVGAADASTTDAGSDDAGIADAGPRDAGSSDDACECVDGFIRAVDADGDGDRSRACTLAPGLDCDDGDNAVTHNACGGCTTLTSALGEDCLECGTAVCNGPDALGCASKPDPVQDPDCRCVDGLIAARDTDGDGQGTRLCEIHPGTDCDDGNNAFVTNACGGCSDLPGTVGAACNVCGVYACNGGALACVPSTGGAGQRCLNATTSQTCVGSGFWGDDTACANVCYEGRCEDCTPGTFRCIAYGASEQLQRCNLTTSVSSVSYYSVNWSSYASCAPSETCNAAAGSCTGHLLLPRDHTFDVAPQQRRGVPWHHVLNTALDADYG